jgi:aminopeptidase N
LEEKRRGLVKAELERILAAPGLSRDLFEIASKSLAISA